MEGPGGYQFVGRTVQMWNRYRRTADFRDDKQWLLRFFDQIRFYPVSAAELAQMREDFPYGRFRLRVQETTLKLREYRAFLQENATSIAQFKARQQAAFDAERERWSKSAAGGAAARDLDLARPDSAEGSSGGDSADIPAGCIAVSSPVAGGVWNLSVAPGARVRAGEDLLVIEAMKMEIPIAAEESGEVVEIRCARGKAVSAGETLLVLRPL
jgi:urea carboxylase